MFPSTKPRTYFSAQGPTPDTPFRFFPSLHRVLRDQFPGFISTMRVLRLLATHPTALRFLRVAVPRLHSLRSLLDGRVRRRGLELVTRCLHPGCCRGSKLDLPSSWGTSIVRLHMFPSDSGRTARTRPLRCSSVALGTTKAKAPTKGLSKLNSMAFGLAVYASPDGLPTYDARLASGRWSGSTGRAFHPQDSYERFQSC